MATKKVIPIKPATSWSFSRYSDYSSTNWDELQDYDKKGKVL